MKLVYGDQVVENASRIKQLVELTVPADAQNGGYAVRQLLGQDPDIQAKAVMLLEVALTSQQIEKLKNITDAELSEIRNGVNPAMIFGVRVYDSEPIDVEEFITGKKWPRWFTLPPGLKDSTGNEMICIRRDSSQSGETFCLGGNRYLWHQWHGDDLQLEEITEPEARAIIAHSVKPTGEWLGCVQWFQHRMQHVIVRRDSNDRCTYFEGSLEPAENVLWDGHMSQWVQDGHWTEITQQEAELRIEQNRKGTGDVQQSEQPGMCKREQFGSGGAPSPRNCDVCQEGPCPRVIPVNVGTAEDPAMKCLQDLARQCGIDPAGLTAEKLGDLIVEHNGKKSTEIGWQQLPADRDMVVNPRNRMRYFDAGRPGYVWCWDANTRTAWWAKEQTGERGPDSDANLSIVNLHGCPEVFPAWSNSQSTQKACEENRLDLLKNADEAESIALQSEALQKSAEQSVHIGFDPASGQDATATVVALKDEQELHIVELTMQSVLTPGLWVVAFQTKEHFLVEVGHDRKRELEHPIPAAKICGPIGVKLPLQNRTPQMPNDYGKKVYFRSPENFDQCEVSSGTLQGFHVGKNNFLVASQDSSRLSYVREGDIWIIDEPTEGF